MAVAEFYTVKRIDNSRLVRPADPHRVRHCMRWAGLMALFAAGVLLYAWQHFQCIQLGYRVEELKAEREQAAQLNLQLKLEAAALRAPMRIDAIARRELGLTVPLPGQVVPVAAASGAVLAQARPDRSPSSHPEGTGERQ
jgi:cell division protein FtsL